MKWNIIVWCNNYEIKIQFINAWINRNNNMYARMNEFENFVNFLLFSILRHPRIAQVTYCSHNESDTVHSATVCKYGDQNILKIGQINMFCCYHIILITIYLFSSDWCDFCTYRWHQQRFIVNYIWFAAVGTWCEEVFWGRNYS